MTASKRHRDAQRAYGQTQRAALTGRAAEAEAFARAAALLTKAKDQPHDRCQLADALAFNQKLWTIMEAEVSDPAHPAPSGIKDDMLSLAQYMDQATANAMASASTGPLGGMIAVNASLSKGLFVRP